MSGVDKWAKDKKLIIRVVPLPKRVGIAETRESQKWAIKTKLPIIHYSMMGGFDR